MGDQTSIPLSKDTRDMLKKYKQDGESWDGFLSRLAKELGEDVLEGDTDDTPEVVYLSEEDHKRIKGNLETVLMDFQR